MPRGALVLLWWAALLISGSEAVDPACKDKKINMMVVIDHSKSITKNELKDMQLAIDEIINGMDFGNLKLGCARFARNGEKVFKLTDIKNKEDYEKIRSSMTLRIEGADFNSGTHTGDGIKKALEEFKNHGNDDATHIMLVISDGKCTKEDKLKEAIENCEKHPNIYRLAVGVGGDVDQKELNSIGSGKGDFNTFNCRNFKIFKSMVKVLRRNVCTVKEQTESTVECGELCLKNGHVIGNNRKETSMIEFQCNPGYVRNGAEEATCQSDGKWSAPLPTCDKVKKCSFKLSLSKGNLERDVNKPTKEHNLIGGKIKHSCAKNFKLEGPEELTCLETGQWSHATPVCKYNVCPPISLSDGRIKKVNALVGGKATFECYKGFELVGQQELTCLGPTPGAAADSPESKNRWSGATPTCRRINCFNALGSIKHGQGKLQSDGSLHFTCNDGFAIDGAAVIKCNGDTPSAPLPECKEVRCKYVSAVKYGDLSYSSDGNTLTLTCKPGYKLKDGDSGVYTCANKQWVGKIGSCVDNRCPIKVQFTNGYIENNNIIPGSVATFRCNVGYKLSDTNDQFTCGPNGQWNRALPRCSRDASVANPVRKCPFVSIKDGSVTPSERNAGDTITCSCNTGFKIKGATTLTCTAAWKWDVAPCRCEAALCPAPKQLQGGSTVGADLHEGAKFKFSCHDGYTLRGAAEVTCTKVGDRLQWSPVEPTCEYVRCPSLYMLRFGYFEGSGDTEGSKRTVKCRNGYALEKGSSEITCQGNEWKPFIDRCERNRCREVKMLSNGRYITKGATYEFGSTLGVRCNERYTVHPAGTTAITCQPDGSWTEATCVYNRCSPLAAIRHGKTRNYNEKPGSKVGFYCDPGYVRNGPKEIECQSDLTWSAAAPKCDERTKCKTLCLSYAKVNSISNYVNAIAMITCPEGKKIVGNAEVTCQADGTWTALPTCEKDTAANVMPTSFGVQSAVGQTATQPVKQPIATKMKPEDIKPLDVCKGKKITVEFCVDTSRSIDPRELQVVRTFVSCLAKSFDLATRFGLTVFNGESKIEKSLADYKDLGTFLKDLLVRDFDATKGGTATDRGIMNMLAELGAADKSRNLASVTITDGVPTCSKEDMEAAVKKIQDFKTTNPKFEAYAVGVGEKSKDIKLGELTTGTTVMRLTKLKYISNENIINLVTQICNQA